MMLTQYNLIGAGGSARVYSGEMIMNDKPIKVAIKRSRGESLRHEYEKGVQLKECLRDTVSFQESLCLRQTDILDHFCYPIALTSEDCIVYPLLHGHPFTQERNKSNVLSTFESVTRVLRIMWENGITHGDINSNNIMIVNENVPAKQACPPSGVPVFIDLNDVHFKSNTAELVMDIYGYSFLLMEKMDIFEGEKDLQDAWRYVVKRLADIIKNHSKESYVGMLRMVTGLMNKIECRS